MKNHKSREWKTQMVENLNLPKDLMMGAVLLHVTGQNEIEVENYRGILLYTDEHIRLSIKDGQLDITGRSLQIVYYTNSDMKITGLILQISYLM